MTRTDSAILMTATKQEDSLTCLYRLIRTTDPFCGDTVFSVFLSTIFEDGQDEEFVYDIARDEQHAIALFSALSDGHVTACTVSDVIHDWLAEA